MNSNEEASRSNSSFSTPVCNIPIVENVQYFIPSCDEAMKPKVGQTFSTLDEGVEFYRNYGAVSGFNTRLGSTLRARGGGDNDFISRRVLCNREGKREESDSDKTERPHLESRVGCRAMIYFRRQKDGMYKVTVFQEAHNHALVSPKSMMFMKQNRNMTSIQKILRKEHALSVTKRDTMLGLVQLRRMTTLKKNLDMFKKKKKKKKEEANSLF